MYAVSLLSDVVARVFRFRGHGFLALVFFLVGLGICALVGIWAGKVAQGKGREFGVFFALGFLLSICGIIPGLIVVIIAYAMRPAPSRGQAAPGAVPPPGGYRTLAPPPSAPPKPEVGTATPSPQGGFEYVPPPSAPIVNVPAPPPP